MFKNAGKELRDYARKRKGEDLPDPRAITTIRTINGVQYPMAVIPPSSPEIKERLKRLREDSPPRSLSPVPGGSHAQDEHENLRIEPSLLTWTAPPPAECCIDDDGRIQEGEPVPEGYDDQIPAPHASMTELRHLAFSYLLALEAPRLVDPECARSGCANRGTIQCEDCDVTEMFCQQCTILAHENMPFHRLRHWNGKCFHHTSLSALGLTISMNHGLKRCPHENTSDGPSAITVLDVNGLHDVCVAWCRCAWAPSHAAQLLSRKLFPATVARPSTAFTFRALKTFHLLNHVGRLTPWDFCGTVHRLTDNVITTEIRNVYKQFNQVQRQWRTIRAWKRAGIADPRAPRLHACIGVECVSCPIPGVNLPSNWQNDPDADLIYAAYLGGDGNMRLSRNNKGGGEGHDPSLFGDDAFYAPNSAYKDFSRVRGGAPDEQSDITCRGLRAGNASRVSHSHNKPCTGLISISCIRSGAFFRHGTVDLGKGERFVNFDFALVQVILGFMSLGIMRLVISYDIACKYHIHFLRRIANESWPLMTPEQRAVWATLVVIWLVPKFHLAAHIEGCADKFSFNWTKDVGRTCGELVETNWASLGLLANSTREMGFGHRRDTLNDAMSDWNWRKATREAPRIYRAYKIGKEMLARKQETLQNLEESMGSSMVTLFISESQQSGGSQFRPKIVESPSRLEILKKIQQEEADEKDLEILPAEKGSRPRSVRVSQSVGINMGLDIEMKQQNLRVKLAESRANTEAKQADMIEARRKMSKTLDAWFATLPDFIPADALQGSPEGDMRPEYEPLRLPSDYPKEVHRRLGLEELAAMERELRIGQAHDSLKKLRTMLGLKSFLTRDKHKDAKGQKALTRSEAAIQKASTRVKKWVEVYRQTWGALERLRGSEEIPECDLRWRQLKPLRDEDCIILSEWTEADRHWRERGEREEAKAAEKGGGRKELPWIWKMDVQVSRESTAGEGTTVAIERWTDEAIRVEWLHAKTSRERWDEEMRLLRAESVRVGRTFRHHAKVWRERIKGPLDEGEVEQGREGDRERRGAIAFAHRQVRVFERLAENAESWHAGLLAL